MQINYLVLIQLLTIHFVVDYVMQPEKWVKDKKEKQWKSPYLYVHAFLHGGLVWLILFNVYAWWVGLTVTVTHLMIDEWKVIKGNETTLSFIADQALHILVIIACWIIYTQNYGELMMFLNHYFVSPQAWLILCGLIVVLKPTSIFIGVFMEKWSGSSVGLNDAGKYIGYLERVLTYIFILAGIYEAIGFLVAAKSILRLGNGNRRDRGETEYVVIGTFMSFFAAVAVSLVVKSVVVK